LEAVGRIEQCQGRYRPRLGRRRLAQLSVTLHLPAGQRLLAAFGGGRRTDRMAQPLAAARHLHRPAGGRSRIPGGGRRRSRARRGSAVARASRAACRHLADAQPVDRHRRCASHNRRRFRAWAHGWRNVAFAIVLVALVSVHVVSRRGSPFSRKLQQESMIQWEGSVPARRGGASRGADASA